MLDSRCVTEQITALHDDVLANQLLLEEAVLAEARAEGAAEAARAVQAQCRARIQIREDVTEQQCLRDELEGRMPGQRRPS